MVTGGLILGFSYVIKVVHHFYWESYSARFHKNYEHIDGLRHFTFKIDGRVHLHSHTRIFFSHERRHAHTFSLHDRQVATGPCALHLLGLPTAHKNSCLVWVGTTCVTKPAVSRLLSEIQFSSCACLIGNEQQNRMVFPFFDSMHCATVWHVDRGWPCRL